MSSQRVLDICSTPKYMHLLMARIMNLHFPSGWRVYCVFTDDKHPQGREEGGAQCSLHGTKWVYTRIFYLNLADNVYIYEGIVPPSYAKLRRVL